MNTKTETRDTDLIEQAKPVAVPAEQDSLSGIGGLMRMVVEKEGSADSLAKVVDLHNAEVARLARLKFLHAMAQFQDDCPSIVNKTKADVYTYATLATIKRVVQPFLRKHGFSYRFTFDDIEGSDAQLLNGSCIVSHIDGHAETTHLQFRVPDEMRMGAKRELNEPQRVAAITTYAMRRLLISALGLTTEAPDIIEDKDLRVSSKPRKGHEGAYSPVKVEDAETLDENQCKTIEKMMAERELDEDAMNAIVMELTKGTKPEWRKIPAANYEKFEARLLAYFSDKEKAGEES